ncbi:hypothetical protein Fcan01_15508 [Folsomia candida]|uniref:Uncharacterized protein n=1 Tax=Folsomia candida TaxID=158441 RepID=A0A226DYB7_FOLCA|nr:hypothetical protein Fcan01_15508 [Folsomia candida]
MQVFIILGLCIAAASAGVVSHTRCGGVGTFREIRIQNCEGAIANMTPGSPYPCEGDMVASTAACALRLKVTATYLGFPVSIIDTVLENSSVQPGVQYTVRFTITPNDILSGFGGPRSRKTTVMSEAVNTRIAQNLYLMPEILATQMTFQL